MKNLSIVPYLIILLSILSFYSFVEGQFNTAECGQTKTCYSNTPGCSLSEPSCLFFSYVWNETSSTFFMEMSGGNGNSQYSGVAFSTNGSMIDSDLYVCTGSRFISGVIRSRTRPILDSSLPDGVANLTQEVSNGVASCTFTRGANVTKEISGGVMRDFNLINENFFILRAFGAFSDDQLNYHQTNRWFSNQAFNFSLIEESTVEATTSLIDESTAEATTAASAETSTSSLPSPTLNCDESKTCFTNPEGCTPLSGSPCMFASWSMNSEEQTFDFEIIGGTSGVANQYVAIAFGTVQDMENADLYYCTESRFSSGVIRERRQTPVTLNGTNGITNVARRVESGVIRCSFTRTSSVMKEVSSQQVVDFNLATTRFYLLMAIGGTSGGQITRHGTTSNDRILSPSTVNFASSAEVLTVHLKLMVFLSVYVTKNSATFWNCHTEEIIVKYLSQEYNKI